jgi:photosystem II stability/assembly factor-like uncharacterized protein
VRITCLFNGFFAKLFFLISVIGWVQANAQTISWASDEGPYSGAIALLTVDAAGDIFVATDAFGIYRSTDGGGSWQPVNNGLNLFYESVLNADSLNNIYTGNVFSGLYASTDKGASWSKTNYVGDVQCVAAISGDRICVGGRQTISISSDVGKTWTTSDVTTDNRVEVASIAEDNSGNIYAGLESTHPQHPPAPAYGGGVYISSDSGKTWVFYGEEYISISSIVISKGAKVFILLPGLGIYSAAPKSNIWTEDDAGIQFNGINVLSLFIDNAGEAVAITNMGIFVYRDALASWANVTPDISLASITSGFYNPTGTTYAGTDENGVFCMRSPTSPWVQCGLDPRPVTSIWFDNSNRLFAGTEDAVFVRDLTAGGWLRVSDGLNHSTVFQLHYSSADKRLYASTASGLFFLPDKGNYWNILLQQWSYGIVESPNGNKYSGASGGILKEMAGTDIWAFIESIGLPGTDIYSLVLDSLNNLYAGTSLNGVFMSTDGGTFWTQSGIYSPLIFYSVKTLALDSEGKIFAGTDTSGAFMSDDRGITWANIPSIFGKNVTCFALDNPSMYFAGTSDRGVFVSTDRGLNWQSANNGLTDSSILSLAFDQSGTLHAGTSKGMYTTTNVTNRIDDKNKIPSTYSLLQNYPNPFNPATVISYQLAMNSVVRLNVYDILGRLVNTLIDERQTAGGHSVTFNGNNLPSGIYFYRLQAGNYVETKKMILLK